MELGHARRLTETLLAQHNLTDWSLVFDNAKRRMGACSYICKQIHLSRVLVRLNDEERVRLTILHEIAHALTPGHGHDNVWKACCIRIGGDGQRCFTDKNTVVATPKWEAKCENCDITYRKHRASKYLIADRLCCAKCRQPVIFKRNY